MDTEHLPWYCLRPLREEEVLPHIPEDDLLLVFKQNSSDEESFHLAFSSINEGQRSRFLYWSCSNISHLRIIKEFIPVLSKQDEFEVVAIACNSVSIPNKIEVLTFLFEEFHVDPNLIHPWFNIPYFNMVTEKCSSDIIQCFLKHGANPNMNDPQGTAFQRMISFREEDGKLFSQFCLHGADVHFKENGNNIFQMSLKHNKPLYAALSFLSGIEDVCHPMPWILHLPHELISFLTKTNDHVNEREMKDGPPHRFLRAFLEQNKALRYFENLFSDDAPNNRELASLARSLMN